MIQWSAQAQGTTFVITNITSESSTKKGPEMLNKVPGQDFMGNVKNVIALPEVVKFHCSSAASVFNGLGLAAVSDEPASCWRLN